ncbi:pentapeptide repeat-containing protein [Sinomonas humi]|uniref:Gram-positive cocci surface proteins LPxTG domain-containing protein n=1 Tax=Sinomonas humi TaxID=1338436 RepID=A0A0B2AGZ6_9MICC|nr:pentapeptide repeat-containing protein [Sinomonas humi]KHL01219.1 hypothetical protein LK10_17520 [Sinomonas humi]
MSYLTSIFAVGASAFFVAGAATSPAFAAPSSNSGSDKMGVCHLTRSQSHPYQYQEVAMSSLATYHAQGKYPGDIFPAFSYVDKGSTVTVAAQNWTTANQAIYAAGCVISTPSPTPSVTPVTTPSSDPTTPAADPTTPVADPTTQVADPTTPVADPTTQAADPTTQAPTTPTGSGSPSDTPSDSSSAAPVTSETPGQSNTGQGNTGQSNTGQGNTGQGNTNSGSAGQSSSPSSVQAQPVQAQPVQAQPLQAVQPEQAVLPVTSVPSEVSLTAQTAAGAPAPDYTTSNAFFASGALMVLGAFAPKLAARRRGRHS